MEISEKRKKRNAEIREYLKDNLTVSIDRDTFLDGKCIKVTLKVAGEEISEATYIL